MKILSHIINAIVALIAYSQEMSSQTTEVNSEKYYINVEADNYHTFKHFNIELQISGKELRIIYLSSEEFGFSEIWKKGDTYAEGELTKKKEKGIPIKVWETRNSEKVLTEGYFLNITENGIEIILETKRKDYKDSYIKIPHEYLYQLKNEIKTPHYQVIDIFNNSYKEFEQILNDFNIERGPNYEHYTEALYMADDIEYPIYSIQTKREFLTRIGICFGHSLYQNNKWKWLMISEHRDDYVGWTIVNPQNSFGIPVEQIFFQSIFKRVNIEFDKLVELIENNKFKKIESGKILLHEPWLKYNEYK